MRKQRGGGFSLVEVLIAVIVLALGVIGAVGMQLNALRTSQQSALQTVATQLATDLADQMRANRALAAMEDARNPYLAVDYQATRKDAISTARNCAVEECDIAQRSVEDIQRWLAQLNEGLPAARARICRDRSPWHEAEGRYAWECEQAADAPIAIKLGWHVKQDATDSAPLVVLLVADRR